MNRVNLARQRRATGTNLARQSWEIFRKNKHFAGFPLITGAACLAVSIVYAVLMAVTGFFSFLTSSQAVNRYGEYTNQPSTGVTIISLLITFVYYVIVYTITNIGQAALIYATRASTKGQTVTVREGFDEAFKYVGPLVGLSVIAATVGMIARGVGNMGRDSKNLVAAIIASIAEMTIIGIWTFISYLTIPVILFEGLGTIAAIKRSTELFSKTWGRGAIGGLALGCAFGLATLAALLPGILVIGLGAYLQSGLAIGVGVILLVVLICAISLVSSAVNAIFKTAIYLYATQGTSDGLLDNNDLQQAFVRA